MSEHTKMVPLDLDLIDEGDFVKDLNTALLNMQSQLVNHAKIHGHKAKKAKAVVKAEITLVCLDPEQDAYACVAQIKTTMPATPAVASMLMGGETQTGEPCLLCRKSGSTIDVPQQNALCTNDGRTVDPDTGEIEDGESEGGD